MDSSNLSIQEDSISNLPDEILIHILSFLPTKYSVRTRILSTKWDNLFTHVPILDFQYDSFTHYDHSSITSFLDLVDSVFICYNVACMTKFCFHFSNCGWSLPPCHITSWVSSVVKRQVQDIDICAPLHVFRTLPRELFSCKTLTSLRLWGHFHIVVPHEHCFPCLKTCRLELVRFSDESSKRLFGNCHLLESLKMNECCLEEGCKIINISAPALKWMDIDTVEEEYGLALDVPNLMNFSYTGCAGERFSGLKSLKSVIEACIHCWSGSEANAVELVEAVCHVRKLSLSCGAIEALQNSDYSMPKFHNLSTLSVSPVTYYWLTTLEKLLDNSPRLEYLSVNSGNDNDYDDYGEDSFLPENVPVCVSEHLKEVDFTCFGGLDHEMKLIRYFLKHAENLKKMKIRCEVSLEEPFEISSTACQIVYY